MSNEHKFKLINRDSGEVLSTANHIQDLWNECEARGYLSEGFEGISQIWIYTAAGAPVLSPGWYKLTG